MSNGSLRICLDPGHSINYNRGVVPSYYESNMNWKLANYLKEELLKYQNTEVFFTKNKLDSDPSLSDRGYCAVKNKCEVFYSIHSDAASASAAGVSVFHSVKRPDSLKLAQLLGQKDVDIMRKGTGVTYLRDNGNMTRLYPGKNNTDYYGVIRSSVSSDVVKYSYIIEHGFHTNPSECAWLANDSNIRELAKGEASVLASYFKLQLKGNNSNPSPKPTPSNSIEIGDIVQFKGGLSYNSSDAQNGSNQNPGTAKVTKKVIGAKHPYHIVHQDSKSNVYGWVDENKISKNGESTPAFTECPYPAPKRELHKGDKGDDVKWVQWRLCDNGYPVSIDGSFGQDSDKKIRQFQSDQKLKVDGWVGEKTIEKLINPNSKKTNPYKEPTSELHKGDRGEGVKWTQWELVEHGYGIAVDGGFGSATDNAVRDFQGKNGLRVDGWVGEKTRLKLKMR